MKDPEPLVPVEREQAVSSTSGVVQLPAWDRIPVDIRNDRRSLDFLLSLRESVAISRPVRWELGRFCLSYDLESLTSLAPPMGSTDGSLDWRKAHRYGQLYWRSGPGFVLVKDSRPFNGLRRFVVDEPEYLGLFQTSSQVRPVASLSISERLALDDLRRESLAIVVDGYFLMLPYRIRKWPIPYLAI